MHKSANRVVVQHVMLKSSVEAVCLHGAFSDFTGDVNRGAEIT